MGAKDWIRKLKTDQDAVESDVQAVTAAAVEEWKTYRDAVADGRTTWDMVALHLIVATRLTILYAGDPVMIETALRHASDI